DDHPVGSSIDESNSCARSGIHSRGARGGSRECAAAPPDLRMDIKKVGVVGCGLMGSGIAQVCAEAGYDVIVREVSDDLLRKGLGKIDAFLAKGVEKGKVKPERKAEVMGRLEGTTALDKLAGCDFVIE